MVVRRLLGLLVSETNRGSSRKIGRIRHNAVEIVTRPFRMLYSIVFMTVLFGVLYTIFYDSGAVAAVNAAEGDAVGMALAFLPPLPILALIAVAMAVLVPLTMLFRDVSDESRYRR
ncbi:hypothetical protein BVU17_07855 [Haloarcula taiwanensis]|uniref:Uncharacterized protein n=1 Tax=Haloarcula taiwanensis TaxID=1932004 RepID=A0A2H4ZYD3_9EURY|nr:MULTISPECIES: hypothetical protein [Haloarcula]AUG47440.1 hypothetical protein BVU17_07855 [Haloarcula taiwanensis]RLM42539.1 hypothetical protein DVK00_15860 [Haloarcula sp. Atlit-47R]